MLERSPTPSRVPQRVHEGRCVSPQPPPRTHTGKASRAACRKTLQSGEWGRWSTPRKPRAARTAAPASPGTRAAVEPRPVPSEAQDGRAADTPQEASYTEMEHRTQRQALFKGWPSAAQEGRAAAGSSGQGGAKTACRRWEEEEDRRARGRPGRTFDGRGSGGAAQPWRVTGG